MSVASDSSCAIAITGKAYCWGDNSAGQLGNGTTTNSTSPVAVSQGAMPAGSTVRQIAVGSRHACVIASNNLAYCWGSGEDGRLGNGTTTNSFTPVEVSQGAMTVGTTPRQISVGSDHTCIATNINNAFCWGSNHGGKLGVPTSITDSSNHRCQADRYVTHCSQPPSSRLYCLRQ